jgi:hypothetical protein
MKYSIHIATGFVVALAFAGQASASAFEERMNSCLDRFANAHDAALVVLQCTAGNGKLSDCKVAESNGTSKGFDKAAMCVADALPMGSKVGDIKIPIRFAGDS